MNRYKANTFTKRASEANKERMLWMQGLEGNSGASMAVRGIPEARNRKGLKAGLEGNGFAQSVLREHL